MKLEEVFNIEEKSEYPSSEREASWQGKEGVNSPQIIFYLDVRSIFIDDIENYLESPFGKGKKRAIETTRSIKKGISAKNRTQLVNSISFSIEPYVLGNIGKNIKNIHGVKFQSDEINLDNNFNIATVLNDVFNDKNFSFNTVGNGEINRKIINFARALTADKVKSGQQMKKSFSRQEPYDLKLRTERQDPKEQSDANTTVFDLKDIKLIYPKERPEGEKFGGEFNKWQDLKRGLS